MEHAIEARMAVMDIGVSTVANMVFDEVMEHAIEARTAVMNIGVSTVANMVFDRVKMLAD